MPQQRQAEVDVIQKLKIGRLAGEVLHLVGDVQHRFTRAHPHGGRKPQLATENACLVHDARDGDLARLSVNRDLDAAGRQVGDPAVQRVLQAALGVPLGAPLDSNPQRHSHSSKPFSQPMPLDSNRLTNCGCTGPRTGERQASSTSPHETR